MKGKLSKKIAAIALAFVMVFALAACGDKSPIAKQVTAEVNAPFELSELETGANWREFSVKKGDTELPVTSGTVFFPETGEYTVTRLGTDSVWKVTVLDTTAPVVHIIGNYLRVQEDSELSEPRVVVIDNADGIIEDYELTVTQGGVSIPVSDGKFTVPTAGDYTLTVQAQDKAGNRGSATQEFTIEPRVERVVKAGERVTLTPERAKFVLPEGANPDDYDYTYEVRVNGTDTASGEPEFVLNANDYCVANITATDKSDSSKTYTAHLTYMEEHTHMLTFTGWSTGDVHGGKSDLWFNPYNNIERTVYSDETGVSSYQAALKDWESHIPKEGEEKDKYPYLCWRIDSTGAPNLSGSKLDISYDVEICGELAEGTESTVVYFTGEDAKTENMPSVTVSGEAGGKFAARKHVDAEKQISSDVGGAASLFQRFVFEKDDLKTDTVAFRIDNFRITPKEKPAISAQNDEIVVNAGEKVVFSAAALGVTATDFFGNNMKTLAVTSVMKGKDKTPTSIADGDEITFAAKDVFYITLTATDWYGNTQETEIVLYDINAGITPPAISKVTGKTDNAVTAGTTITLADTGIAKFVNVTDDGGSFTLTYDKVLKNGEAQTAAGGGTLSSFTVAAKEVWEVFMTATDSDGNESKGYIQFIESSIAANFASFNDDAFTYNGGHVYSAQGQRFFMMFTPSDYEIYKDEYGKKTLRVRYESTWQFTPVDYTVDLYADVISQRNVQYSISVVGSCDTLQDTDVLLSLDDFKWTKADLGKRLVFSKNDVIFTAGMYINELKNHDNFAAQENLWLEIDYVAFW